MRQILAGKKELNGMSNMGVAKAVEAYRIKKYSNQGGYVHRSAVEIIAWEKRTKAVHRQIVSGDNTSGASRKVALPGEKVTKGMVSPEFAQMCEDLFGKDPAQNPKLATTDSAAGGLSAKESAALAKQQEKAIASKGATAKSGSTNNAQAGKGQAKKGRSSTAQAPATHPPTPTAASLSDDAISDVSSDVGSCVDSDEEAAGVLGDDNVDEDAAAAAPPKKDPVMKELKELRAEARDRTSEDKGNSQDRQKMHQMTASHAAFQEACTGVKNAAASSTAMTAVEKLAQLHALDALKERGIYDSDEYDNEVAKLKGNGGKATTAPGSDPGAGNQSRKRKTSG